MILDDGFQHRRLARDCEIVLVDARMPLGGWPLLPRGPMREPLQSLARAHVVMVTHAEERVEMVGALTERLRAYAHEATFVTAQHEPESLVDSATEQPQELRSLEGKRVGLVSSIGDPQGFEAMVCRLNAQVLWHRTFPDHHRYRSNNVAQLVTLAHDTPPELLVTTQKDWVRLRHVMVSAGEQVDSAVSGCRGQQQSVLPPVWVLGVKMRCVSGEEELHARLARLCHRNDQ